MPAVRGKKRKSNDSVAEDAPAVLSQKIPTKPDSSMEPSPAKKRKVGVSLSQKQALIDNLQLEITERARKLRANYNLHAQSLRTRIEIRINRIPMSLRRAKMGDLLIKYSKDQQRKIEKAAASSRPPPVPEKDNPPTRGNGSRPATAMSASTRTVKRLSDQISGGNKENMVDHIESPKKKARGPTAADPSRNPGQVLSPTSSNTRVMPRDRAPPSPAKSMIARPVSPTKTASATNMLSSMVEKARAARTGTTQRKATNASTASSSNGSGTTGTATATRTRRGANAAPAAPATRTAATRTARRVSGVSESSDGSTSTVVRKRTTTTASKAAPAATAKRTVMSTIKKGMSGTGTKKAAAAAKTATAAPATTATGRVLRKRA